MLRLKIEGIYHWIETAALHNAIKRIQSQLTTAQERERVLQLKLNSANHDYTELLKERAECVAKNERLRDALDENAAFVYNHAISTTPSGELRNKLTELNILRLQALKE